MRHTIIWIPFKNKQTWLNCSFSSNKKRPHFFSGSGSRLLLTKAAFVLKHILTIANKQESVAVKQNKPDSLHFILCFGWCCFIRYYLQRARMLCRPQSGSFLCLYPCSWHGSRDGNVGLSLDPPLWNISIPIGWTSMKFHKDIHSSQRINPNDLITPWIFL